MKKSISFDVDTHIAEMILGDTSLIYKHIGDYLKKNGFHWKQGSVYISNERISYQEVHIITKNMYVKYPYMRKCIRDIITQSVGKENSLNHLGEYDGTVGKFDIANTVKTTNGPIPKDELRERILNGEEIKIIKNNRNKTKYIDRK